MSADEIEIPPVKNPDPETFGRAEEIDLSPEEEAALNAACDADGVRRAKEAGETYTPPGKSAGFAFDPEQHPHKPAGSPEGGQFAPKGAADAAGPAPNMVAGVDPDDFAAWDGNDDSPDGWKADGYRIQNGKESLPGASANRWHDAAADAKLPGVSCFNNLAAAANDIAFGWRDRTTGENYSRSVRESGGDPELWVLLSDYEPGDMPGGEVTLEGARVAAKFTRGQVRAALREALSRTIEDEPEEGADPADAFGLSWEDLTAKYEFGDDEFAEAEVVLRGWAGQALAAARG